MVTIAGTGPDGVFTFGGLRDGYYRILLWDTTGRYAPQYYGGAPGSFAYRSVRVQNGGLVLLHAPLG
jgi:hypothetical protein